MASGFAEAVMLFHGSEKAFIINCVPVSRIIYILNIVIHHLFCIEAGSSKENNQLKDISGSLGVPTCAEVI
jgi:hypothetical protein